MFQECLGSLVDMKSKVLSKETKRWYGPEEAQGDKT